MPIYEYKCPACSKVFEEWVKTHDTSPQVCPDCGQLAPHIVSNTTFVLKGGGWYVTDYGNRKGENGASAPAPGKEAEASSSAESSASESKAAPATSESKTNASSAAPAASSPAPAAASSAASAA